MQRKPLSLIGPASAALICLLVLGPTASRYWRQTVTYRTSEQEAEPVASRLVLATAAEVEYEPIDRAEFSSRATGSTAAQIPAFPAPPLAPGPEIPLWQEPAVFEPRPEPAPLLVDEGESQPQADEPASQPADSEPVEVAQLPDEPRSKPAPQPAPVLRESEPTVTITISSDDEAQASEPVYESTTWPLPRVLLDQLAQFSHAAPSERWPFTAADLICQLCRATEPIELAPAILPKLQQLSRTELSRGAPARLETLHTRAQYSLQRWIDIWSEAALLDHMDAVDLFPPLGSAKLRSASEEVDRYVRGGPSGTAWRQYLLLAELQPFVAASVNAPPTSSAIELADKIIDRLHAHRMTDAQRKFLAAPQIAAFEDALRGWMIRPVTARQLLENLERYEFSGRSSDAQRVATDLLALRRAKPAAARDLAEKLEGFYRNANVRVAASDRLLNQLLPQPKPIDAPVADTVLNTPTFGQSTTITKLKVRLVPDPERIRVGLEATGLVASDTVSVKGPARLYNNGQSTFLVRKLMLVGPRGMTLFPAVAEAENNYSYLVSMETGLDGVPLVGSLVRSIARSQYEEMRGDARIEVEQKVAIRARDQLDAEVGPKLTKAVEDFQKRQLATIHRLDMELSPIGYSTTDDRVAARVRLAGADQLGGHTPRPRAPSDSDFSIQLHESALNNFLDQLDLAGRRFTLEELFAHLSNKLDRPKLKEQQDLPDDVVVTFADKDPVRVRCVAGHIDVMFAFAELKQGKNKWRDFAVRAEYTPQPEGLDPRFGRDPEGIVYLEGKSVSGMRAVTVRGIFTKVLSRSRDLSLLDESLTSDPRLADLKITQFTVEDGWIGLAYAPKRPVQNVVRRPK